MNIFNCDHQRTMQSLAKHKKQIPIWYSCQEPETFIRLIGFAKKYVEGRGSVCIITNYVKFNTMYPGYIIAHDYYTLGNRLSWRHLDAPCLPTDHAPIKKPLSYYKK